MKQTVETHAAARRRRLRTDQGSFVGGRGPQPAPNAGNALFAAVALAAAAVAMSWTTAGPVSLAGLCSLALGVAAWALWQLRKTRSGINAAALVMSVGLAAGVGVCLLMQPDGSRPVVSDQGGSGGGTASSRTAGTSDDQARDRITLTVAVRQGDVRGARAVITRGPQLLADDQAFAGWLLLDAVTEASPEMVRCLVEEGGAAVNAVLPFDCGEGRFEPLSPLAAALLRGRRDTADTLLALGADPRAAARPDLAPLAVAAAQGDVTAVDWLLAVGGMSPHADGGPALAAAAAAGSLDVARLLLEAGADVHGDGGPDGPTPLHLAVRSARYEVAELLLTRGADPQRVWFAVDANTATSDGSSSQAVTPLDLARQQNDERLIELLLRHLPAEPADAAA